MPLGRRNLKKLASLSAVGAGAIAITADKAEASAVFVPLSTPVVVGFGAGDVKATSFTFKAFNDTFSFGFSRYFGAHAFGYANYRSVAAFGKAAKGSQMLRFGATYFPLRSTSYPGLKIVKAGGTFKFSTSSITPPFGHLPAGARFWASGASTTHFVFGNGSFSHDFALFAFGSATAPGYGWVDLSFSMTDGFGPACGAGPSCKDPNKLGPELTIWGYAYDSSGNPLPAGSLTTPEPDTLAATGLAALALGAAGMRRWRRKRAA